METCPRCKAYVQPEWDRCKICGLERLPDGPPPPGPGAAGAGGAASPPGSFAGQPGAGGPPAPLQRSPGRSSFPLGREAIIVGVVGLVLVIGAVAFVLRPSSPEVTAGPATTVKDLTVPSGPISPTDDVAMGAAVDALCSGASTSIGGAVAYPAATGAPHPIVTEYDRKYDQSFSVPSAWKAADPANAARPVELVLCSQVELLAGKANCGGYAGVRIDMQDANWTVELRSAATGAVVASTVVPGTSDCPTGFVAVPDKAEARPRKPDQATVDAFVEPWVMAP